MPGKTGQQLGDRGLGRFLMQPDLAEIVGDQPCFAAFVHARCLNADGNRVDGIRIDFGHRLDDGGGIDPA